MKNFLMSFLHAWRGIKDGFGQRNMKIHVAVAVIVVICGLVLKLSYAEWLIIAVLVAIIFAAELFNTAIENEASIMRDTLGAPFSIMGRAKDLSAGAVLILAIASVIVGLAIFLPKVVNFVLGYFK